jgi:hypothetical protein
VIGSDMAVVVHVRLCLVRFRATTVDALWQSAAWVANHVSRVFAFIPADIRSRIDLPLINGWASQSDISACASRAMPDQRSRLCGY